MEGSDLPTDDRAGGKGEGTSAAPAVSFKKPSFKKPAFKKRGQMGRAKGAPGVVCVVCSCS